jgi:hypothetical protein
MDLAPLLYIVRAPKMSLLFLIWGRLAMISSTSVIFTISSVSCVNFPIVLLILRVPLDAGLKKSSPSLGSHNAYVSDCEQIGHHPRLLHGDFLHSLDIIDPVAEGVDDLNVLYVRDSIPDIAEIFHVVSEALIRLLLDDLQCLYSRWTLICILGPYEHGT